jgi:hypothetical protein
VLATDLLNTVRSIDATRILVDHQSNPVKGVDYKEKRAFGSAWKTHLTRSALQLQAVKGGVKVYQRGGAKLYQWTRRMIGRGVEVR